MTKKETRTETESKTPAKESAPAAPVGYGRGENQKDVSDAYRKNWHLIFGKKRPHIRATGRRHGHGARKH